MKFEDIPAGILVTRMKPLEDKSFEREQPVLSISASITRPDVFELRFTNDLVFAAAVSPVGARQLGNALLSGQSHLGYLYNLAPDGSAELHLATFPGETLEMGNLDIGIDEYVEERVSGLEKGRAASNPAETLYRHCVYRQGKDDYFFLLAGSVIEPVLKEMDEVDESDKSREDEEYSEERKCKEDSEDESHKEDSLQDPSEIPSRYNSFCMNGDRWRFAATKRQNPDGKKVYVVSKLTTLANSRDRALRLAKGKIRFVDHLQAREVQILAQAQLHELLKEERTYLKKWDEYGNIEGDFLLQKARRFDVVSFGHKETNRSGAVSVVLENPSKEVQEDLQNGNVDSVEIVKERPSHLQNLDMSFTDFCQELGKKNATNSYTVKEYRYESRQLFLEAPDLPCENGLFCMSFVGEIAQIKRRMTARAQIANGRSANPQLGLLIEKDGVISTLRSPHKVKPLTAFVRDKVFRNAPTVKQEEAIRIALNTPDIALIQGPPGTGKTTVIAAILERLNEEYVEEKGERPSNKGRILLSGFQHDAVENMIDRLTINSLPVPKFGGKQGAEESDISVFQQRMDEWCANVASEIRKKNPQLEAVEQEVQFRNLCVQYLESPSLALAQQLLTDILALDFAILGELNYSKAKRLLQDVKQMQGLNEQTEPLLPWIQGLRVTVAGFQDDGPDRACDLLEAMEELLSHEEKTLLQQAADWMSPAPPDFLPQIKELKKRLLVRFTSPPIFTVNKHNEELVTLTRDVIQSLREHRCSAKDQCSAALVEFLTELENNPMGMVDAVSEYSFAFAATCQQSVNRAMQKYKGIVEKSEVANGKLEYDYVIIDEAARVSPRDLMIPMVQGKRIILVGDHRQLPHIIDEEVARQMEAGEDSVEESDWLEKSMFSYLFSERLKELEKQDPEHTRRITLDKQFRMHPILGDFISRNFYERFALEEKFGSGLPAKMFEHNLPRTNNSPVVWLEVPGARGKHKRMGTSWIREEEAAVIARQLQEWMASPQGEKLSYGVISFYKAQSELIKKQLGRQLNTKNLRIGTVDSFQGMEFDVVFLSMVRTFGADFKIKSEERKKAARQLFGHLCLYNRLNVSMSRQKKLLVVVGDSALLRNELAEEFIPGLVDFYRLCQKEGVIINAK